MQPKDIYDTIRSEKIVAIVRDVDPAIIVDIAEALFAGGIKLIEVTCNTSRFAEMISTLSEAMAGRMIIGAGTATDTDRCQRAMDSGAQFLVAPDVNPAVIEFSLGNALAVLPGAATATEILTAGRSGAEMVKIFPAAAMGLDYIRMLKGPIDNIDFVAVGGVRPDNMNDFFAAGCVGIGIGGSITRQDYVASRNWNGIKEAAIEYVKQINVE